jgi:pyruvate dehydrogenase E2 component (dihydrolipoamide acetyltransferase)
MPTIDVKLPNLGDGIKSGDILEVLVSEGDTIKKDQGLAEVETDKASVEVPSTHAGKVTKVHIAQGQTVAIGGVLVTLEVAEGADAAPKAPAKPAPEKKPEEKKPEPKAEEKPQPKPTPAPPKAESKPAPARQPAAEAPKPAPAPPPRTAAVAEESEGDGDGAGDSVAAGPAVRRFAREVGVNLRQVKGTGASGRITRDDVLAAVRQAGQARSGAVGTAAGQERDAWGPIRVEKLSRIRKTIASKMHESWTTCARVTNFDDADVTELEKIRQASKDDYAKAGIKLTSLPFIVKALAMALKNHPAVNGSIDLEEERIVYKDYVNIGIAVDSERGLVVPSLRGVDHLSIPDIARGIATLAEKVRDQNFGVDDLRGSTFTISNLGAIGGTYSTPIINYPEAAILLVGRARKLPVVVEGDKFAARLMLPLSLSYDHRLIDGATAARFLNEVIGYLKAPGRLLLAP